MSARLLVCFVLMTPTFGQFFSVTVRAGDPAPDIDWSKVVRSPDSARYKPSLTGQYTILSFLPNVTANARSIAQRNDLIAKFADQPVQFVWIASEPWSDVEPFLKEHPMSGWLLVDEKREMARAYGCDFGGVVVDPAGEIVGFGSFVQQDQISAILEGKAVAIPRDTPDDQVFKLLAGGKVRLDPEPRNFERPHPPEKPDIAPSYEVHISPSQTNGADSYSGPDFWARRGFNLRGIVSIVYGKEESRVILPAALDTDDRFDFVMILPKEEEEDAIHEFVRRAIEKRFAFSAAIESQSKDVYVLTAIRGKTPPAKTGPDSFGGGFAFSRGSVFTLPPGIENNPEAMKKAVEELVKHPQNPGISNLSADNSSMPDLCKMLEMSLGRPVLDETGLDGVYDIEVQGDAKNTEEFIRMLREQAGLILTPATRSVEMLVMRSLK